MMMQPRVVSSQGIDIMRRTSRPAGSRK